MWEFVIYTVLAPDCSALLGLLVAVKQYDSEGAESANKKKNVLFLRIIFLFFSFFQTPFFFYCIFL